MIIGLRASMIPVTPRRRTTLITAAGSATVLYILLMLGTGSHAEFEVAQAARATKGCLSVTLWRPRLPVIPSHVKSRYGPQTLSCQVGTIGSPLRGFNSARMQRGH
jgi:hypothetical protein